MHRYWPLWASLLTLSRKSLTLLLFASLMTAAVLACGDGAIESEDRSGSGLPNGELRDSVLLETLSVGSGHTCRVTRDGSVFCWGSNFDGQSTPPDGEFSSVSAGTAFTCAVKNDESLACWGSDLFGQLTTPVGEFSSVSSGWKHACGLRKGGSAVCWGGNEAGQASPPTGDF